MKYFFKSYFTLLKGSLLSIFKSPSAVVFSVAFPLIFILVFGFIKKDNERKFLVGVKNNITISNLLNNNIQIPSINFEKYDTSHFTKYDAIVERINNKYNLSINENDQNKDLLKYSLSLILLPNKISFEKENIQYSYFKTTKSKPIDFILPGQLGFALLAGGVFGTAFLFFNLRQTLVLKRFFATPVKKATILLAEGSARLVFQMFSTILILGIGYYFFGFTLLHGFLSVIQILILCALGSMIFMGLGFFVSSIAKNEAVIAPLSNIFTLPQFLLAGTFFPIDVLPNWLQWICKIMPLTYLNSGIRKIASEGLSLWDIRFEVGVLLLIGIIIYSIVPKFFKWN